MMMRYATRVMFLIGLLAGPARPAFAATAISLVREGEPQAVLLAADDARVAAERWQQLLREHTGTTLPLHRRDAGAAPPPGDRPAVVFCTLASRQQMREHLPDRAMKATLKPEGFLIQTESNRLIVIGADDAGLRYGVGELWNYHLRLDGRTASVPATLWLEDAPAYSKRILWNWNFMTNWEEDLRRIHQTQGVDPGGTLQPYLEQPDGYLKQFRRVIDFAADHKLNGLIIYGFVNDGHGGVESAQELSRYARAHAIRVLPGVGTVIYGGYYHGANDPDNPYSLTTWLAKHPEVERMIGKDGKPIEAPCPSSPELRKFLEDGARWFFTTFPDIGGVNLEHGDFFECQCARCKEERAKPENDNNFLWDMMYTQVPVVKIGREINPYLWMTYSPYWGYRKEFMENPPKFLRQYPEGSIVQWTYSGMVGGDIEQTWPAELKAPPGAKHSIGLLHQGSYWCSPAQWWGSPGQTYALVPDVIQRACARAIQDGSEGLEIVGQIGKASPQNELNYLAFEEFTWHPERTWDDWLDTRLAPLYGGPQLARRFYEIVSDETKSLDALTQAKAEADRTAGRLADPRQARRWRNLAAEMARRHALVKAGTTQPFGPGPVEGLPDVVIEF